MMGLAVEVRRRPRDGGQRFDLADQIVPMNRITSTHHSLQHMSSPALIENRIYCPHRA